MSDIVFNYVERTVTTTAHVRHVVSVSISEPDVVTLNVPAGRGPRGLIGDEGPPGPKGDDGVTEDIPDLVLIFENHLI